jgi:hypothetical protein
MFGRGGHFEPKNRRGEGKTSSLRSEPNQNYLNCRSVWVSGFGFNPGNFIFFEFGFGLVTMIYNPNRLNNPKFNIFCILI